MPGFSPGRATIPCHNLRDNEGEMVMTSLLSLLTGVVLIGLVYGLSFIPSATLPRPDDDTGLEVVDEGSAPDESGTGGETGA
jgi:hypothetical protein